MSRILKSLSLWQQIFLCCLFSIIIPVTIVFAVYSYAYINTTVQDATLYSENELEILDDNFTNYLHQFTDVADNITLNRQFMDIIAKHNSNMYEYEYEYIVNLQNTLKDIFDNAPQKISTLIYIDNAGTSVSVGYPYYGEISNLAAQYKEQTDAGQGRNIWNFLSMQNEHKIVISKQLNYVSSQYQIQKYGYLFMLIDEETLHGYYKNLNSVNGSELYIVSRDNVIISSSTRAKTGTMFEYDTDNKNAANAAKTILMSKKLDINDWTIVIAISKQNITRRVNSNLFFIALITIICILLAVMISFLISRRINRPLRQLSASMEDLKKENFNIELQTDQTNEIGHLYDSFNHMAKELNLLINKNIALQLKTKEAQIQSYQRQINPHFIYNTLDLIRMMSLLNENNKIEEAVICLSKVLRFNLKAEKEVTISQELENIEFYFKILTLRYGENFNYVIRMPEDLKNYCTLKFLLQPFIENSVQHGLEKVDRKGYICIIVKKIDDEIIFIIKDNGIGIEKDKLKNINETLESKNDENNDCIGMKNVNQRIKLKYGEKYGIEIFSKYNIQTSVTIHIPAYRKGEEPDV